ncbi:YeeE/YedE family integral membrane protein-like protein [Sporormia fimetaria CBS 119925]|uniref:YeeE/YedE family integral membrane protein-like protein n=1 Tax=Sporormia fimetaria CBS 119925 TaxID=1340428 RepID=A0A6A6VGL5_9PLEO|nr:YeeE/YedE family integral membrane protein-like protein [Sporormia fimetaria CBS 119925]
MFTPVETSIGAFLLHEATTTLLYQNGNVLGASGLLRQLFSHPTRETLTFFAGMAASLLPLKFFLPDLVVEYPVVPTTLSAAVMSVGIGALVGWGTKLAHGCTSGHMLCGLSRLSPFSLTAVATFFPVALLTHHIAHPSLYTSACPSTTTPCYTPTYPSKDTLSTLLLLATLVTLAGRYLPSLIASATTNPKTTRSKAIPASSSAIAPARLTTRFLSGLTFGLGLQITGMAHPSKVLSFLSFPNMQVWDPSMGLVILFGIVPNLVEIQMRGFGKPPMFNSKFEFPVRSFRDVDWKLVLGSAAFGVGWGLSGTCPGPAVLRAMRQPVWGLLWVGGFWAGGKLVRD